MSRRHKGISWLASITPQARSLLPPSSGAVLGVGCVVCVVVWSQPHQRSVVGGMLATRRTRISLLFGSKMPKVN